MHAHCVDVLLDVTALAQEYCAVRMHVLAEDPDGRPLLDGQAQVDGLVI